MSVSLNPQLAKSIQVEAYVLLVRSAELLHADISRGLLVEGLTPTQFSTLKALKFRGSMPQKDIASYLLKTGGNVTMVVDNLEKAGYVERIKNPEDRRLSVIRITPAGEELFDRVYPPHLQRIEEAMATLSEEDCASLVRILRQVCPGYEHPVGN